MCEDFAPNFGEKDWLLHQDNAPTHNSIRRGILDQKQHDCSPPPTLHSSVSPIENKTEKPPF
jgi:hypothetical protein